MGAWGVEPFENDEALDWHYDLKKGGRPVIDKAFAAVQPSRDVGKRDGCKTVAAAAVVCAVNGRNDGTWIYADMVEELAQFSDAVRDPALVARAIEVLPRVMNPKYSENALSWRDSDHGVQWLESMERLLSDLRALVAVEATR